MLSLPSSSRAEFRKTWTINCNHLDGFMACNELNTVTTLHFVCDMLMNGEKGIIWNEVAVILNRFIVLPGASNTAFEEPR